MLNYSIDLCHFPCDIQVTPYVKGIIVRQNFSISELSEVIGVPGANRVQTQIDNDENKMRPANRNESIDGVASGLRWTLSGEYLTPPIGHAVAKRALDVVLSFCALIALFPLLFITGLFVGITSKGPIFFVQWRPGLAGRPFPMLKFRTMYAELGDTSGVQQTRYNDPRITPLGQILRKTSIDELPQLVNVLLGHMSLVGPRPHALGMRAGGKDYRDLVPYYDLRHAVRPGLSGWAQVNGLRGPTIDPDVAVARIDHDLAYIQNASLLLDLKIILRTAKQELVGGSGL